MRGRAPMAARRGDAETLAVKQKALGAEVLPPCAALQETSYLAVPAQVCEMFRSSFQAAESWQRGVILLGEMRELRLGVVSSS